MARGHAPQPAVMGQAPHAAPPSGAPPGGGDAAAPDRPAAKGRAAAKARAARVLSCSETGPPRPNGATPQQRIYQRPRAGPQRRRGPQECRAAAKRGRLDQTGDASAANLPAAKDRAAAELWAMGQAQRAAPPRGGRRREVKMPRPPTGQRPRAGPQRRRELRGCWVAAKRDRFARIGQRRSNGPARSQKSSCYRGR